MLKGNEAKEAYDLINDLKEQLGCLSKANSQLRNKVQIRLRVKEKRLKRE